MKQRTSKHEKARKRTRHDMHHQHADDSNPYVKKLPAFGEWPVTVGVFPRPTHVKRFAREDGAAYVPMRGVGKTRRDVTERRSASLADDFARKFGSVAPRSDIKGASNRADGQSRQCSSMELRIVETALYGGLFWATVQDMAMVLRTVIALQPEKPLRSALCGFFEELCERHGCPSILYIPIDDAFVEVAWSAIRRGAVVAPRSRAMTGMGLPCACPVCINQLT
jgi:hypothetical protein